MCANPATAPDLVSVVHAPDIPGLAFRHGVPDDWAPLTAVVNRARAADGVDEVFGPDTLRAEYEPMEWFDIGRDVLIAEIDGEMVGMAFGWRVQRGTSLALESWGVVLAEHRHQGIGTALHRATRARLAVEAAGDPRPGERSFRSWALDIERSDMALLRRRGVRPDPVRVRDAPARSRAPCPSTRSPTGSSSDRSPRTSTARSSTPTTRHSATTGATGSRTRATSTPDTSTPRPTPRCGAWRGMATRSPDRS